MLACILQKQASVWSKLKRGEKASQPIQKTKADEPSTKESIRKKLEKGRWCAGKTTVGQNKLKKKIIAGR